MSRRIDPEERFWREVMILLTVVIGLCAVFIFSICSPGAERPDWEECEDRCSYFGKQGVMKGDVCVCEKIHPHRH